MDKDIVPGGLADNKSDKNYGKEQLSKGIEVEMEHTDDPLIAKEIAKDHLEESDFYYTYLEKMENEMEKEAYTRDGTGPHGQGKGPGKGEGCDKKDDKDKKDNKSAGNISDLRDFDDETFEVVDDSDFEEDDFTEEEYNQISKNAEKFVNIDNFTPEELKGLDISQLQQLREDLKIKAEQIAAAGQDWKKYTMPRLQMINMAIQNVQNQNSEIVSGDEFKVANYPYDVELSNNTNIEDLANLDSDQLKQIRKDIVKHPNIDTYKKQDLIYAIDNELQKMSENFSKREKEIEQLNTAFANIKSIDELID